MPRAEGASLPIGPEVVPFGDYLKRFEKINHKKELLRGLWVVVGILNSLLVC